MTLLQTGEMEQVRGKSATANILNEATERLYYFPAQNIKYM